MSYKIPIATAASGDDWRRRAVRTMAWTYVAFMIALPVVAIARRGLAAGLSTFWSSLAHPVARSALFLSVKTAVVMAVINACMGTLIAYVLVRYRFRGRRWLDAVIDLPFAIPTLVTGLMLVMLLGPQTALGRAMAGLGLRFVYALPAIVMALLFVTLPFVVRAVQPVLMELDVAEEEAALTLGATEWQTFRRVVWPSIRRAVLTGTLLSFARALGEFGSIVVVSGNIPRRTLTAAVFVFGEVESGNLEAASAMSLVLVAISFCALWVVETLQPRRVQHA